VGKGLTFDSGGLSLKPAAAMETMKSDMGGAAAVFGAMQAVAELKLPIHVVGLVSAAENMPSSTAYRPGDVVTTLSGKTIEVINTDAEGRIILSDALFYAQRYEPAAIVELSTLTGAIIIALGSHAIGMMGTDQGLADRISRAGEASAERVWQLPLWDEYHQMIKSKIADLKNLGGAPAGSITAGAFLAAFVGDYPFVHLDIAGTAWLIHPSSRITFTVGPEWACACSWSASGITRNDRAEVEMTAEAAKKPRPKEAEKKSFTQKLLDGIEKAGNKVPHPVLMFLYLIIGVIVLSHILYLAGVSVTEQIAVPVPTPAERDYYEDTTEPGVIVPVEPYDTDYEIQERTIPIRSLLTTEGIRFLFSSFVGNFQGFGVIAVTFIAMMGAGVAEAAA
jgi:hypothetical protein